MKVAVPLIQGKFSEHFGGAEGFGLFEVDELSRTVVSNIVCEAPPHERGVFPRWLHEKGANVILAGGMGTKAVQMFEHFGVQVVAGARGEDPEAIVRSFLNNTLEASGETCTGGHLHHCAHHGEED